MPLARLILWRLTSTLSVRALSPMRNCAESCFPCSTYADTLLGDGWSLAYRTIDAQYFGVPQRRRRIYLVADFAGGSAGEILFESQGVSRNFTPSGSPWKGTAGNAETGPGTSSGGLICLNDQGGSMMSITEDITATLRAEEHGHQPCVMQSSGFCTEHSAKSRSVGGRSSS